MTDRRRYRTSELLLLCEPNIANGVIQNTKKMFYVCVIVATAREAEPFAVYLHDDGSWNTTTSTADRVGTGYFDTEEQAKNAYAKQVKAGLRQHPLFVAHDRDIYSVCRRVANRQETFLGV